MIIKNFISNIQPYKLELDYGSQNCETSSLLFLLDWVKFAVLNCYKIGALYVGLTELQSMRYNYYVILYRLCNMGWLRSQLV